MSAKRFNPPPNWPPVPQGWTPPPGWQPDPSWPAPPPGWKVWVDDRRGMSRSAKVGIGVIVGLLALCGIGAIGSALAPDDKPAAAPATTGSASPTTTSTPTPTKSATATPTPTAADPVDPAALMAAAVAACHDKDTLDLGVEFFDAAKYSDAGPGFSYGAPFGTYKPSIGDLGSPASDLHYWKKCVYDKLDPGLGTAAALGKDGKYGDWELVNAPFVPGPGWNSMIRYVG